MVHCGSCDREMVVVVVPKKKFIPGSVIEKLNMVFSFVKIASQCFSNSFKRIVTKSELPIFGSVFETMKRFSKIRELTVWFFLGTCFVLSGCSGDSTDNKEYLVRVNDFHISTADVDKLLKLEIQLDSNFYLSEDTRTAFVQQLVQTQLLIQEARKRKLDERESFRQTIQRHWECTLIRDLLEEEGEQIRETTVVTQEEIEAYFLENKDFLGEGTLQQLSPELSKKIEDKKVTDQLEKWIAELKSAAIIDITDQKLAAQVNRKND